MGQLDRSNRHRAMVIEIYEDGAKAAVQFTSGRVECVVRRGMAPAFEIGQRGTVDYVRALNGYEWVFEPAQFREAVEKCFACGRTLRGDCHTVRVVGESTLVYVGPECFRHVAESGPDGWLPPRGGARVTIHLDATRP